MKELNTLDKAKLYIGREEEKLEYKTITLPGVMVNKYGISDKGDIIDMVTTRMVTTASPIPMKNVKYKRVDLKDAENKPKKIPVHRLVAWEYVEGFDENAGRTFITHLDGNRFNNHFSNLKWTTLSEANMGKRSSRRLLTDDEAHIICLLFEQGTSAFDIYKEITKCDAISENRKAYNNITDIKYRKGYVDISSQYKF